MLAQRKAMDVLTNNLANVTTTGFKRDSLLTRSFSEVLIGRINDPETNSGGIGTMTFGVHADDAVTSFEQGSLEPTGRAADLAIVGDGFFVVETPDGLRYTRNGNFQVNDQGFLCTAEGYYVRGTNGRINVGSQGFAVDLNGNITTAAGGNARLQLVTFADPGVLTKAGANLFSGPLTAANATGQVRQGWLEGSNVELGSEMVTMISVQRNYEANQRMINMINDTLQKTVNEVGRI